VFKARGQRLSRQSGALSIFTAFAAIVLIGSVGLAIDTGRAYAIHDELQAAVDGCALSAALELNGAADATSRASTAGRFVAGKNKADLQGSAVVIPNDGMTFASTLNGNFVTASNISSANARYVRCTAKLTGVSVYLMSALGINALDLSAQATAGVVPSQLTCSLPMALCAGTSSATGNVFGYLPGQKTVLGTSASSGFFTWANVGPDTSSSGLDDFFNAFVAYGTCNASTAAGRCIGIQTGVVTSLDDGWNSRFGVYKSGGSSLTPENAVPDLSGYGYRDVTTPPGGQISDYINNKLPNRTPNQLHIAGYSTPVDVNRNKGSPYRRLAVMPFVQCTSSACGTGSKPIIGWACVLLLAAKSASQNAEVEIISRADDLSSPCRAAGVPGGVNAIGPLVPVIVQ
jgi:Flp pilus assembly protein TadG